VPRGIAVELFANVDNIGEWQPGLLAREQLDGAPGRAGAKARLRHRAGRDREVVVVETIVEYALPDTLVATYDMPGLHTRIANRFEELGPRRTRWTMDVEFRSAGLMKLVEWLIPKYFTYPMLQSMRRFKTFAEAARGR
jgi:hypothetical protein